MLLMHALVHVPFSSCCLQHAAARYHWFGVLPAWMISWRTITSSCFKMESKGMDFFDFFEIVHQEGSIVVSILMQAVSRQELVRPSLKRLVFASRRYDLKRLFDVQRRYEDEKIMLDLRLDW